MKTSAGSLPVLAALFAVVSSLHAAAPAPAASSAAVRPTASLVALLRAEAQAAQAPAAKKTALPDGPGKAEAERVCSACHAPNVFTHQRHDQAGWSTVINNMIAKGADGSDDDFAKILAYLVANFGPDVPLPADSGTPAPAKTTPPVSH